ncbi:MAG TPA: hypothetical protein VFP72_19630 [Kineosporiaceae bacterium]|nr:hypothetical protein [Kineosporiaceae bacterium]
MRTNQLFTLAVITTVVGVLPWFSSLPLGLKLFGAVLTLVGLFVAYLTGSVMLAGRRAPAGGGTGGCGACETCSCSTGSAAPTV